MTYLQSTKVAKQGNNLPPILNVVATLLLITSSAVSQPLIASSSALDCVTISDDKERLACYDAYYNRIINAAVSKQILKTPEAKTTQSDTKLTQQVSATPPKTPTSDSTELKANVNQIKIPTTSTKLAEEENLTQSKLLFGFEDEVTSITPDEIKSTAIGNFKEWKKKMKVTLKNGQVWQITSSNKVYHRTENPPVVITKGSLGSFYMKIGKLNARIKVKRVK